MSKILPFKQHSDDWHIYKHSHVSGTTLADVYSEFKISVAEIKEILTDKNIDFKGKIKKDDLLEMLPADSRAEIEARIPIKDRSWHIAATPLLNADLLDDEKPMDRGTRLEGEALDIFEKEEGFKLERGMVLQSSLPIFMVSPDGVTKDLKILVEVKCLGWGKHFKAYITKQVPDEHMSQVISYFIAVPTSKFIDVVFYDPRFYDDRLKWFKLRVYREEIETEIQARITFLKNLQTWAENIRKPFKTNDF